MILLSSFLSLALLSGENCTDCHSKLKKIGRHEAAIFGCTFCHTSHEVSNGYKTKLKEPIPELCFQCHNSKKLLDDCFPVYGQKYCGHPVSGHPISAKQDLLYPEREFNCISCHNPHSSDMPKLFRYHYQGERSSYQGNLCVVCHWKMAYSTPPPPVPPWNTDGQ